MFVDFPHYVNIKYFFPCVINNFSLIHDEHIFRKNMKNICVQVVEKLMDLSQINNNSFLFSSDDFFE